MIRIIINNEDLDIDFGTVVTFKKSQQLNGIQNQYSFSNNFNLKNTPNNRRILGINYLPNSKAKSMTVGYSCGVILNGCIFLKNQTLKIQKESEATIPVFLIFTDSFFVAKSKEVLMNQTPFGVDYVKNITNFLLFNNPEYVYTRTAPVSAQDSSTLVVVDEVPILLNIVSLVKLVLANLNYAYSGDFFKDENAIQYYTNQNIGIYGDGKVLFDDKMTAYDFITNVAKTFNFYIDVSDSEKSVSLNLWKNIETIKQNFIDYSEYFTNFKEYAFEGGLAKTNEIKYSSSPDFFNGFFENNKSILEKSSYLTSSFGAGTMRLFEDQEEKEDGTIELRTIGEITEAQTMNIYRFDENQSAFTIYSNGIKSIVNMYRAFSPNILEIWQSFHQAYCKNISLPTIGQLSFRYDAVFLSNLKMQQVFFIKQLSTYWLPLEINFSTNKDKIDIKCLMLEKTETDKPVIFDLNVSIGFYQEYLLNNIFTLYSAQNVSPASTIIITEADLTKNKITINDIEVLSFPTSIDVSNGFVLKIENAETINTLSTSDISFQMISEEGGESRIGKITVVHNGYAKYVSEFKSNQTDPLEEYFYEINDTNDHWQFLNYSQRITSLINIPTTEDILIGNEQGDSVGFFTGRYSVGNRFKAITFQNKGLVYLDFNLQNGEYKCSNRGGGAEARTNIKFLIYKNGQHFLNVHSSRSIDSYKNSSGQTNESNINRKVAFRVQAGDYIQTFIEVHFDEEDRPGSGTMDGSVRLRGINWKFTKTERL